MNAEPCPSLKINIPKDASKPDGDAVENGALLSVSELHACGHFVNSPSDTAPILGTKTKYINDNPKNKLYQPPKHSNALDDEAPEYIYTGNGEEVTSEELADELTRYFNFESAPIEREEGEEGEKPSAQEVLLNLLLWWKVSTSFMI